jgi:hypothetical protein
MCSENAAWFQPVVSMISAAGRAHGWEIPIP